METLVADVRVRSKPRTTDSYKFEPLLPTGTQLYVLDGPITASGYEWYWVTQLTSAALPSGWVAAASRDGEAWLGSSEYDCPPVPTDLRTLTALPDGVGLACFSRVPITFRARLFEPNGDVDPGSDWIEPNWLFYGYQQTLMVDPSAVPGSDPLTGRAFLLDPEGTHPATLPIGVYQKGADGVIPPVVTITGMFDHPASEGCEWVSYDPPPAAALPLDPAVETCRLEFAVTKVAVP